MNRVSVKDAASEMKMSPLTLRYLMASGQLQIGFYSKKPYAKRGSYIIFRKLLDAEKERLGIE